MGSRSPWHTAVPPTIQHSAYNSLRMQASQFMTLWKVLSVPRDSTTSAFNYLRLQPSQFMTFWKEMSVPPDSTTSLFNSLRMQTIQKDTPGWAPSQNSQVNQSVQGHSVHPNEPANKKDGSPEQVPGPRRAEARAVP